MTNAGPAWLPGNPLTARKLQRKAGCRPMILARQRTTRRLTNLNLLEQ